ncbi:MAG: hypothetical protein FWC78_00400 [Defluviitaleaceae bacterium]|nr:hypothetical protein [Defluviitaleaceae bacterium]
MNKLYSYLRKKSKQKSLLGTTLLFLYTVFGNPAIQAMASLAVTVAIGITVNRATAVQTVPAYATYYAIILATSVNWRILVIPILVFAIVQGLIVLANGYKKRQAEDTSKFLVLIDNLLSLNAYAAHRLYELHLKICKETKLASKISVIKSDSPTSLLFQEIGFDVCKEIYSFIERFYDCKECEVVIYERRFDKKTKDDTHLQVVAYELEFANIPTDVNEKHYLSKDCCDCKQGNQLLLSIFENSKHSQHIFYEHNKETSSPSTETPGHIYQRIALPIRDSKREVVFILQLTVYKENCLGSTEDDLAEFAQNILLPFAKLLHPIYESDRLLCELAT